VLTAKKFFVVLCCLLFFSIPSTIQAKYKPSFTIGNIQKEFPTDALCTFQKGKKWIFIDAYSSNEFWTNLNGQDTPLTWVQKIDDDSYEYKTGDLTVIVDYGPGIETPPPGKRGMDGTLYPKAKITFKKGIETQKIKVNGACF
jgi:hypothetical protein